MPIRNGDSILIDAYNLIFASPEMRLLPITHNVLVEAARLRATIHGLRTPDAIHAATALIEGCAMFVTNDVGFRRIPGLPLAILDEILAAP